MSETLGDGKPIKLELRNDEAFSEKVGDTDTVADSSRTMAQASSQPGDFDARSEQSKFTEKQKNTYRPFHQVMETRGVPADIDAGFIVHKADLAPKFKRESGSTEPNLDQYPALLTKKEKMEEKEVDMNQYPALPTKKEKMEEKEVDMDQHPALPTKKEDMEEKKEKKVGRNEQLRQMSLNRKSSNWDLQVRVYHEREKARDEETRRIAQARLDWSENLRKRQDEDEDKAWELALEQHAIERGESAALTASNLWLKAEKRREAAKAKAAAIENAQGRQGADDDKPELRRNVKRGYIESDSDDDDSEEEPVTKARKITKDTTGVRDQARTEDTKVKSLRKRNI